MQLFADFVRFNIRPHACNAMTILSYLVYDPFASVAQSNQLKTGRTTYLSLRMYGNDAALNALKRLRLILLCVRITTRTCDYANYDNIKTLIQRSSVPVSHMSPVYPAAHVQLYAFT